MSIKTAVIGLTGIGLGVGLATYRHKSNALLYKDASLPDTVQSNNDVWQRASKGIVNPSSFFKFGFPGPIHDLETREEFISCYNRQTRNPYWVLEHLTPKSLGEGKADRKNSKFMEDENIPESFRARLKDYFRSGYDRGHQAAAANAKFSQSAMDDTFYLTNMSPQVGAGFNRDYWAHFEYFCRGLTKKYNDVFIVTGPLYLPKKDPKDGKFRVTYEVIGNPPNIAVPTHFFKLIVAGKDIKSVGSSEDVVVGAFVLPNEPISNETKLTDFQVPVNALERASGLEFLKNFPMNKRKMLCQEVNCQIVVRDFSNKALPPNKSLPLLPPGKN
ncbi:hypothetical protein TBLA_0A05830 [Henningerozyma blattae CBS 6284]|uniref:Endonuclease n=1 Tax=Henningerozyma blattae (strain ATCC 34711 / CBS 6284 / DSM 70876 / NBRC 10599 / NRRL Y-10934 / UCD 77-7) TaxID=1071380 RepID=I2GW74_HENB6|nr:hypothetical protein TBLA_0A05830 [Tetrapisispora blattae CBS 6284]CCH58376.1 hypothetical protein TBLA_0A05830 [Tetrapisispora blattae CBS 6284]